MSIPDGLQRITVDLCAAAQKVYDEWEQDEDGVDPVYGCGGICDAIASCMGTVLSENGFDIEEAGTDEHAAVYAVIGDEYWMVDIPAALYETGGGYRWRKIPGVQFQPSYLLIYRDYDMEQLIGPRVIPPTLEELKAMQRMLGYE